MRTEIERIVEQVHRSFAGDAWHGPSVSEALCDVPAAVASAHPVAGAHSIAELAAHLERTQRVIIDRIGGRGRPMTEDAYWPPIPPIPTPLSDADWSDLLERLKTGAAALEFAIAAFATELLDTPLMEGGSSAYNNFLGHAQHNTYHAGQIMLLRKLAAGA